MKKHISVIITIIMIFCYPLGCFAEDESKGLMGSASYNYIYDVSQSEYDSKYKNNPEKYSIYETKTTYRYRDRSVVNSNQNSIDGYAFVENVIDSVSYSDWRTNKSSNLEILYDNTSITEISTESVTAYYCYSFFDDSRKYFYPDEFDNYAINGCYIDNNLTIYSENSTSAVYPGSYGTRYGDLPPTVNVGHDDKLGEIYLITTCEYSNNREVLPTSSFSNMNGYRIPVHDRGTCDLYRNKITKSHNVFEKWGEWSDWSTIKYTASSTRQVESQNTYTICETISQNDNADSEGTNASGNTGDHTTVVDPEENSEAEKFLISITKKCISVKSKVDYTGSVLKPSVTVKCKGKTLKKNRDYKLSYSSNKYPGTGKVIVKGIGNYKGTVTATFKIQPKPFSITSAKGGRKSITVKWKRATAAERKGITGFQIRYTRSKNLKSGWKTITGKKDTYSKLTKRKLKAKAKYYVEIRSYVTVKIGNKAKTYYSPWSKAVAVKTK